MDANYGEGEARKPESMASGIKIMIAMKRPGCGLRMADEHGSGGCRVGNGEEDRRLRMDDGIHSQGQNPAVIGG